MPILLTILIYCFIGWLFCDIEPGVEYGWLSGIWHGMFFVPNWIRSWFTDALYKADCYTTGYNIWWWIMTVSSCIAQVGGYSSSRR